MSRTSRLFDLMQILRSHRYPVTGTQLASDLNISLRTLYRDIATLQELGANIQGESGIGYILHPGFTLPPLMFTEEEIEALVLGARWVSVSTDQELNKAAKEALAKISSVLPIDFRHMMDANSLMVLNCEQQKSDAVDVSIIRNAIRAERKLTIGYEDVNGIISNRVIWPIALGYYTTVRILAGWCELRNDFRHFRVDRISTLNMENQRYPRRRLTLFDEWREQAARQSELY